MSEPRLYLLDVEGTVAPVSFVTETLFPYARKHLEDFLTKNFESDEQVQEDISLLVQENSLEHEPGAPNMIPGRDEVHGKGLAGNGWSFTVSVPDHCGAALAYVNWLMDRDRKSTALKSLQGRIWKAGYERGELQSELFEDVPEAFARWSREARIAIYSSGSAEAQELFFRHSIFGDLTPMISGYFDTRIGPKQEPASYAAIAAAMQIAPVDVLFFSDVVRELDAARTAGCGTRLVVRPGNAPVDSAAGHAIIRSLAEAV